MSGALAAVLRERGGAFRVEQIEVGEPAAGEVLVAVRASGICHTDLIVRDGFRDVPLPVVLGHEGAGVVVETGPGVDVLAVGDSVVLGFPFCGRCIDCVAARPYNCPDLDHLYHRCERADGSDPFNGAEGRVRGFFAGQSSFASHTVVAARNVVRVPDGLELTTLGPLACGVSTGAGAVLNALRPSPGSTVVVFGLGAVGLSAVMAAAVCGCSAIVAVDPLPARRELAMEMGATAAVDAKDPDVVPAARRACGGGAHYAVEATGIPHVVLDAVASLCGGGRAVYVGNHPEDVAIELPLGALEFNQSLGGSVLGHSVPRSFIPLLLELHRQGRLPFEKMLRFYPQAEVEQAVADMASGTTVKPVLVMP